MPGPGPRLAAGCVAALVASAILPATAPRAAPAPRALDLPLYAPESGRTHVPAYAAHKLVVELAPPAPGAAGGAAEAALGALAARFGPGALEPLFAGARPPAAGSAAPDLTRFYVVHLQAAQGLAEALDACARTAGVRSADPVGIFPVAYAPNDPLRTAQYALGSVNGHGSDLYGAWDVFRGDSSIVIGVLDTGVEYPHPDIAGPAAPYTGGNLWTNWAELAGAPGVDDDGDGEVDDFRGWDFVTGVSGHAGEDVSTPDNAPTDYDGHGTEVAGVASARTDNGAGIAGAGFRTRLMAVRVGWQDATGQGVVDMSFCAQGIHYAVTKGAAVINCSWGNGNLNGLGAAVDEALARGVLVVDAAGNASSSQPTGNYLAQRGDCVDVASVDSLDVRAGDSNYGAWIDVSAAGVNVLTTTAPTHVPGYATVSGTSFAAPLVSGAAALFQGYRRALGLPLYSPERLRLRLTDTGDPIDADNPGNEGQLGTRLDVRRLLTDPPASWVDHVGGAFTTSPLLADLTGCGRDAIVVGGSDGLLVGLGPADGDTLVGWPVDLGAAIHSTPAAWDVDQDGHPDAVVGTQAGRLFAIKGGGAVVPGWPVQLTGDVTGGPAIGDLTPGAGLECVAATDQGFVYVLDRTGAVQPGWPKKLAQPVEGAPALSDLDGDGRADIVLAGLDSTLYAWRGDGSSLPGWPKKLGGAVDGSPAVGDVDHDGQPDVVVGALDHEVYAFHADGSPLAGWPVTVAAAVHSSPALADLDGDGALEVIVGLDGGTVTALRANGTFAPGWPRATGGDLKGGVVVGNIDADPGLEVVAGGSDGRLYAWHANGVALTGWPRDLGAPLTGTPSLGDPDRDTHLEIVLADQGQAVRCLDMGPGSFLAGQLPWPTFHRDALRRGSTANLVTAAGAAPEGPSALRLTGAPNPARGAIRFALTRCAGTGDDASGALGAPARVSLYDVRGRRVRTLTERADDPTGIVLLWGGADEAGRAVPPGLYFARARWAGQEAATRIVRLP